jgi:hypothetical protein
MKTSTIPACLLAALAVVASGCREQTEPHAEPSEGPVTQAISYVGGAGSRAHVSRARTPDGGELLRGETVLSLGASAGRCVIEDVTLDARGHLTRAEITVAAACNRAPEQRLILDPSRGEVRATAGGATWVSSVPADAPWVYTPPSSVATPVSAWVAARAAKAGAVRQIEPTGGAALVERDQIAVETERGLTVIVANDGADVDASFVEQVRLSDYGVTLVRVPASAVPAPACPDRS